MTEKPTAFDLFAIAVCTLIWGTTWFVITLQFGVVDSVVSVAYRFMISAAVLFVWAKLRGEKLWLSRAQHIAAFGMGFFTFGFQYTLVYWAEERISSAVVAVMFAAMAFVNLTAFRIVFRQRASLSAWGGAALGVLGVAILSWGELAAASLDARAWTGVTLAAVAVISAAIGNVSARSGEQAGAPLLASTAWAMLYGVMLVAPFITLTGRAWAWDPRPEYLYSLLYLAVAGSVIAFALYYALARRRGYATASYIAALTPVVAMIVSSVFEEKTWSVLALLGAGVAVAGQYLLLRARRA
jgi:drug/metabolite transporter (DMT)-like permease